MNKVEQQEYGDFQTPDALALSVCEVLKRRGVEPASIIEPTCGLGSFLAAAVTAFPRAQHSEGLELNVSYIAQTSQRLRTVPNGDRVRLQCANFFEVDWRNHLSGLPEPILLVGNPPWVTNAKVGLLGGNNLPAKTNFQKHRGFDAITGKSNFDISEWMMIRLLEAIQEKFTTLAMLCKIAVARKALLHAWKTGIPVAGAALYRFDAKANFNAAVDACLFVVEMHGDATSFDCSVFESLDAHDPSSTFGFRDGHLIADVNAYEATKELWGNGVYQWRSGVKHDCTDVMEFTLERPQLKNGLGERVDIEPDLVFPMFKGSSVARGEVAAAARFMLVPQRFVGDDTARVARIAPKTWAYLLAHGSKLNARASSIYRNRPQFSVFGIGDYTFAPWKVVTAALYKTLTFRVVGPIDGRPAVFDDTCNFLPCESRTEAIAVATLLGSERAARFFDAFVFWDAKRPITIDLVRRLDLSRLAYELGQQAIFEQLARRRSRRPQSPTHNSPELSLFQ